MAINSTIEQLEAINARDCNLLVSAAAGSGKTSVLIDRILGRIFDNENPIDVDQLLVVTFSKAAASEMRERLAKELGNPELSGEKLQRARKQQVLLIKSTITTIHSFCLDVIKENFHLLDIDPSFRVADDNVEIDMLSEEVLEKLFDELYEEMYADKEMELKGIEDKGKSAEDVQKSIENEQMSTITERAQAFSRLLECYSGNRSDQEFAKVVMKVRRQCMNEADPIGWLDSAVSGLGHTSGADFAKTVQGEKILELVSDILEEQLDLMEMGLDIVRNDEGLQGYEGNFVAEIEFVKSVLSLFGKSTWNEIYSLVSTFSFARLGSAKKTADEESKNFAKSIRDGFKKELGKLQKAFFYGDSEKLFGELEAVKIHIQDLSVIVKAFMQSFKKEKNRLNLIDFNDMEHLALELFKDSGNGVADKYRKRFEEIYIDEYQDSNRVQETILTSVSRVKSETPVHNVFMVGDLKQSIYGFRKADPTLFKEKLKAYSKDKSAKERVVVLNKNFRSRKEVVSGANDVMTSIMSDKVGDIEYTGDERLEFGAEYYGESEKLLPGLSIEILDKAEKDETLEDVENESIEGAHIAGRIQEMINSAYPVWDGAARSFRPAQYRDFAVLMRSTKGFAGYLEEEFVKKGIPYFVESSGGYFDTLEISLIISLLKILDNPRQDIPLISVLRSTIGNYTDSQLVLLRSLDKNMEFYDLLKLSAKTESPDGLQAAGFLEKLAEWRKASVYMPSDKLLWMLYEETDLYNFVGVLPKGKQRQANLRFLYEKAALYEKSSFKGLFNFVKYLERQIEREMNAEKAKLSGAGQNVVHIMSVHKSKGLEYPVVILCNTGKQFNMMDSRDALLIHGKLGFGPDIYKLEEGFKYPSVLKECIRYELKRENLSEEMRILYVALTRAKEKLIFVGTGKAVEKKISDYSIHSDSGKVPSYLVLKGSSFLDWILMYISAKPSLLDGKSDKGVNYNLLASAGGTETITEDGLAPEEKAVLEEEAVLCKKVETNEAVERILSYRYKYEKDSKRPGKISVTGLKKLKRENDEDDLETVIDINELNGQSADFNNRVNPRMSALSEKLRRKPSFMSHGKTLTGAERGTATHFIMQLIDFKMEPTETAISNFVNDLVSNEQLTKTEALGINTDWVLNFLKSDICRRINASSKVIKEGAFKIMIPASEAGFTGTGEKDEMLLQGIVDCLFIENGEWIILDYKTDYYEPGKEDTLEKAYGIQLDWYGRAVEAGTHIPVKEKILYLFRGNKTISLQKAHTS